MQVMACPAGCLNGGGQLKPSTPSQTAAEVLQAAEVAYHHPQACLLGPTLLLREPRIVVRFAHIGHHACCLCSQIVPRLPSDNPVVAWLYGQWVRGDPGSAAARMLLHTSYRHRGSQLAGGMGQQIMTPAAAADW
jgi:hypothetical protein